MKIDIVVVYVQRYRFGHEKHFVHPITGIQLAAITPSDHEVRVIHQQVEDPNFETDADLIGLSFFSGFAPEAYRLAGEYRKRGKLVVAGGPHATFAPLEVLEFCDSVVTGEAESIWSDVLEDVAAGDLKPIYRGSPHSMQDLPTPRYDLLPKSFFVQRVIQATRGCPFTCSFCTVPTLNPGFRVRPVEDVIRDIRFDHFLYWWQRKIVWFWDDNLTAKRRWMKELLVEMKPLRKWWLTQASMEIADAPALLDLMRDSGCIGVLFGIESFGKESLEYAHKKQNKVADYRRRIDELHKRGICVMAGFISGLDGDSPDSIVEMAEQLTDIGVDVPFLSILTPFQGTPDYKRYQDEGRLLKDRGWEFYNGYNVTFQPRNMSPSQLLTAHRDLWKKAFSIRLALKRVLKGMFRLRWGALLMSVMMNFFYALKAFRGNTPINFEENQERFATVHARLQPRMHPVQHTERVSI